MSIRLLHRDLAGHKCKITPSLKFAWLISAKYQKMRTVYGRDKSIISMCGKQISSTFSSTRLICVRSYVSTQCQRTMRLTVNSTHCAPQNTHLTPPYNTIQTTHHTEHRQQSQYLHTYAYLPWWLYDHMPKSPQSNVTHINWFYTLLRPDSAASVCRTNTVSK